MPDASPPHLPEQNRRFPDTEVPWSPGAGLMVMLGFILIQSVLAILDLPYVTPRDRLGVQVGLSNALILIFVYGFLRWQAGGAQDAARALGLRLPRLRRAVLGAAKPLLIGVPVLVGAMYAQSILMHYLQYDPPQQPIVLWLRRQAAGGVNARVLAFIFLAVVAAPLTEEVIFRGVLYLPLRGRYGPVAAAVLVSLIFASIHGYLAGVLPLFILALIFTWLLEKTGTLLWPILAHAAYNGTMVLIMLMLNGQI